MQDALKTVASSFSAAEVTKRLQKIQAGTSVESWEIKNLSLGANPQSIFHTSPPLHRYRRFRGQRDLDPALPLPSASQLTPLAHSSFRPAEELAAPLLFPNRLDLIPQFNGLQVQEHLSRRLPLLQAEIRRWESSGSCENLLIGCGVSWEKSLIAVEKWLKKLSCHLESLEFGAS